MHAAAVAAVTMEVMDRAGDLEVVDLAAAAVDLAAEDLAAEAAAAAVAVEDSDLAAADSAAADLVAVEAAAMAVDLAAAAAVDWSRGSKPARDPCRCRSHSIQPRSVLRHLKLRQRHRRCHQ